MDVHYDLDSVYTSVSKSVKDGMAGKTRANEASLDFYVDEKHEFICQEFIAYLQVP